MDKFQIFELDVRLRSGERDVELEEEFHNFFYKYGLTPLFTNEHRAGTIVVKWTDARSVINPGGSYHESLKQFADIVAIANDNKSLEEALFKVIYQAKTFQTFMKRIRKLIEYFSQVKEEHKFNFWNIVFYNKEVY